MTVGPVVSYSFVSPTLFYTLLHFGGPVPRPQVSRTDSRTLSSLYHNSALLTLVSVVRDGVVSPGRTGHSRPGLPTRDLIGEREDGSGWRMRSDAGRPLTGRRAGVTVDTWESWRITARHES